MHAEQQCRGRGPRSPAGNRSWSASARSRRGVSINEHIISAGLTAAPRPAAPDARPLSDAERRRLLETVDRLADNMLPDRSLDRIENPWEWGEWIERKVGPNCHVRIARNHYSEPEHMPDRLRVVSDIREPDYGDILLERVRKIGPNAVAWAERCFASRDFPEQAFANCTSAPTSRTSTAAPAAASPEPR